MFPRISVIFVLAALLACVHGRVITREENDKIISTAVVDPETSFEQWTREFGVTYQKGTKEWDTRFRIWFSNVRTIIERNKGVKPFWLGINQFTDLTFDEFVKIHIKSDPIIENTVIDTTDKIIDTPIDVTDIPSIVDWNTNIPDVTDVGRVPVGVPNLLFAISKKPVVVTIDFTRDLQHYVGGIFDGACDTDIVKHRIVAVGYNTRTEIPFITLKTRFGINFGESGFVRFIVDVKDRTVGKCGVASDIIIPKVPVTTRVIDDVITRKIPITTGVINDIVIPKVPVTTGVNRDVVFTQFPVTTGVVDDLTTRKVPITTGVIDDIVLRKVPVTTRVIDDDVLRKFPITTGVVDDITTRKVPFTTGVIDDIVLRKVPVTTRVIDDDVLRKFPITTGVVDDITTRKVPITTGVIDDIVLRKVPVTTGVNRDIIFAQLPVTTGVVDDLTTRKVPVTTGVVNDIVIPKVPVTTGVNQDIIIPTVPRRVGIFRKIIR